MWEWVTSAATGSGLAILAWVLWRFHSSAIRAHEKRADDWRDAYRTERAVSRELSLQVAVLQGQRPVPSPNGGAEP